MLVKFKVGNFCSFKEPIEFTMEPTRERLHRDRHLHNDYSYKSGDLLKVSVIYGANASGKSNFIKAFEFAEWFVTKEGGRPNKPIGNPTFKLDKACKNQPTTFYFEIQSEGQEYSYEFHVTNEAVVYEELRELNKASERLCFRRTIDQDSTYEFGPAVEKLGKEHRQLVHFIADSTRKNRLFLTESVDRNLDLFEPVYSWFNESIRVFTPSTIGHGVEFQLGSDSKFTAFVKKLLIEFDPSVVDIESRLVDPEVIGNIEPRILADIDNEIDENVAVIIANIKDGSRSVILKKNGALKLLKIYTKHRCVESNEMITFDLDEESDGTKRIIELAPLFFELLFTSQNESVVAFIDELDRSLHPLVTKRLLEIFLSKAKKSKTQIIISTHNSILLDQDLLRRDEIWIVDKSDGISKLKSLQRDFSPRYDKDIRKEYLLGMYGGIPRERTNDW